MYSYHNQHAKPEPLQEEFPTFLHIHSPPSFPKNNGPGMVAFKNSLLLVQTHIDDCFQCNQLEGTFQYLFLSFINGILNVSLEYSGGCPCKIAGSSPVLFSRTVIESMSCVEGARVAKGCKFYKCLPIQPSPHPHRKPRS